MLLWSSRGSTFTVCHCWPYCLHRAVSRIWGSSSLWTISQLCWKWSYTDCWSETSEFWLNLDKLWKWTFGKHLNHPLPTTHPRWLKIPTVPIYMGGYICGAMNPINKSKIQSALHRSQKNKMQRARLTMASALTFWLLDTKDTTRVCFSRVKSETCMLVYHVNITVYSEMAKTANKGKMNTYIYLCIHCIRQK